MKCDHMEYKRCAECFRPVCQRNLLAVSWEQDISMPAINEYSMHELFMG